MKVGAAIPIGVRPAGSYSLAATFAWAQFLLIQFPEQMVTPLVFLPSKWALLVLPALMFSILQYAAIAFGYAVLSTIVDAIRGVTAVRSETLQPATLAAVSAAARRERIPVGGTVLARTRVAKSDLSMGAHVRGVFRPTIVLSAGAVVGLLRADPRANAIVCHEAAHISHYDRLLPGAIGLCAFEGVGSVMKVAGQTVGGGEPRLALATIGTVFIWKLIVLSALVCLLSRNREFYADARAMQTCTDPAAYVTMLEENSRVRQERWSFFHPTFARRYTEVAAGFPGLRRGTLWRLYLLAVIVTSLLQRTLTDDPDISLFAFAATCVAGVLLGLEPFRPILLRGRTGDTLGGVTSRVLPRPLVRMSATAFAVCLGLFLAIWLRSDHPRLWLWGSGAVALGVYWLTGQTRIDPAAPREGSKS